MTIQQAKEDIKFYFTKSNIDKVFLTFETFLFSNPDKEFENNIQIKKAEWITLKRSENLGIISYEQANLIKNSLYKVLLEFSNDLGQPKIIVNTVVNNWIINGIDLKNPKNLKEFLNRDWIPSTIAEFDEILNFANIILEFLKTKITKNSDFLKETLSLVISIENFNELKNSENAFEIKKEIAKLEITIVQFLELEVTNSIHPIDELMKDCLNIQIHQEFFDEFESYFEILSISDEYKIGYNFRKNMFLKSIDGKTEVVYKAIFKMYKNLEKTKLKNLYNELVK